MRRIEDEQTSTCEEKTNAALALAGMLLNKTQCYTN